MPRRKGSKNKKPYPESGKQKQSIYKKLINKLGKEAVNTFNDLDESDPDEYYYDDNDNDNNNNNNIEETQESNTPQTEDKQPQETKNDVNLLQEMTGLKQKLSQYEEQLNEYRDLAKEHRQFLAEQKAFKKKLKEEQELNARAERLAEEKIRKLRKQNYQYEADTLSALLL